MTLAVLVLAKAPVPGCAKTRLAADLGAQPAAELAAAALLDTLDVVEAVAEPQNRMISLAGNLAAGCRAAELAARLAGWRVRRQLGDTFADRLVAAHRSAANVWPDGRVIVQIGTDTPGLTADDVGALAAAAARPDRVALGPATDGGWWGLAFRRVGYVGGLVDVPMSTAATCRLTRAAIERRGALVTEVHPLTDVDDLATAHTVSRQSPNTRFARCFADLQLAGSAS
jgi:glycosyltransferase A (GT-A) superfamily protein (DUF2064 family)